MVVVNSQVPVLLTKRRGVNDKIVPIVKAQRIRKYNNDQRRTDEQETNDAKATAVILRIQSKRES